MAAPIIVASLLMLATGTLAVLAWIGGTADGERLRIDLTGTCSEASVPLFRARVAEMGLGNPEVTTTDTGVRIKATMPGTADDEATHVPSLLARRGLLVAGPASAPVFTRADLDAADIRLDESGLPYTWIELNLRAIEALEALAEASPEGELAIRADQIDAPARPNSKPIVADGIRLLPGGGITRDLMRSAADHAIVLNHGPLPCEWRVGSVTSVDPVEGDG
jgi:preprotein translocase subunit SecD